jgi:ribonuclease BN (tRNA processing enzyme)
VRGSTPAPGPNFVRYGGHTSCVALARDGASGPELILDAGTGIRRVTDLLDGKPFVGSILLTHLHWDHTQGLPFFVAGDRAGSEVSVLLPADPGDDPTALFGRAMSPPHFPIEPMDLRGAWTFGRLEPGELKAGGLNVLVVEVPHKGGTTYGFRISDDHSSLTYIPDHGPTAAGVDVTHEAAIRLAKGTDLLLHDSQHTAAELEQWVHFGHSSVDQAARLAIEAGARRLALFHHGPARTDEQIDQLLRDLRGAYPDLDVDAAAEEAVWEL